MTDPVPSTGEDPGVEGTLPRFFNRVADAIGPIADLDREQLAAIVAAIDITVVVPADAESSPALHGQAELACNLLARLYPNLRIVGPAAVAAELMALVLRIHPAADVRTLDTPPAQGPVLYLQPSPNAPRQQTTGADVRVNTSGWNTAIDIDAGNDPPYPLAALAAACLGVGEMFRHVFAAHLQDRGRTIPTPSVLNLITCGAGSDGLPDLPYGLDVTGTLLAGAGAVGQAFLLALRAAQASGTLGVVDHDSITLPNLQRYVLTDDTSPGQAKTAAAAAFFEGTALTIEEVPTRWGADGRSGPLRDTVAVALDTAADRIAVAAGMHRAVYNAWTQPEDLGWSRHDNPPGGDRPCLACAYWPIHPRPSDHELIAQALQQHPLRMLLYLLHGGPIGAPIPPPADGVLQLPQAPGLEPPPDLVRWFQVPLAADLVAIGVLPASDLAAWAGLPLSRVYRDGVCAGGLIAAGSGLDDREALVPLAHQSALAGIMLAVQVLTAGHSPLRDVQPVQPEGRVDLLRPLPQTVVRPRLPTTNCLCRDFDFQETWRSAWTPSYEA